MGFLTNFGIGMLASANNNFQEGQKRREELVQARMDNLYREKQVYETKRAKGQEERVKAEAALAQLQGMHPDMGLTIHDAYSLSKSGQLNDILDGKIKLAGVKDSGQDKPQGVQGIGQQTQGAFPQAGAPQQPPTDPRDTAGGGMMEALKFGLTGQSNKPVDAQASARFQSSTGMGDEEMQMMKNGYASELDIPTGRTYDVQRGMGGMGSSPTERMLARYVELAARPGGSLTREEQIELSALELARTRIVTGADNTSSVMNPRSAMGMGGGGGFASRTPHQHVRGPEIPYSEDSYVDEPPMGSIGAQPTGQHEDPYLRRVDRDPGNAIPGKAGMWALNGATPQAIGADIRDSFDGAHGGIELIDRMYKNLDKTGIFENGSLTGEGAKSWVKSKLDMDPGATDWLAAQDSMRTIAQQIIKGTPSNYDVQSYEKTFPNIVNNQTHNLQLMREFVYKTNSIIRNNIEYMKTQRMPISKDQYDLADRYASKVMELEAALDDRVLQQEMENNAPAAREETHRQETTPTAAEQAPELPTFKSPKDPGFDKLPTGTEFYGPDGKKYRKQ